MVIQIDPLETNLWNILAKPGFTKYDVLRMNRFVLTLQ